MLAPVIGILMMTALVSVFNYQAKEQGLLLTRLQNVNFEHAHKLTQLSNQIATNHTLIYELLQTAENETEEGEFYDDSRTYRYEIYRIENQIKAQIEGKPGGGGFSKSETELLKTLLKHIIDYRVNTTNAMLMATVNLALAKSVMSKSTKKFNQMNAIFLMVNQSIQQRLNQRLARHQDTVEQQARLFAGLFVTTIIVMLLISGVLSSVLSRNLQRSIKRLGDVVSRQKLEKGEATSSQDNEIATLAAAIDGVRDSHTSLEQARDELKETNQRLSMSYDTILERETALEDLNAALEIKIIEGQKVEKQLFEAKEEAEKANQSKSKFLTTMSHEFRTPLNAILGFSEIMGSQFFGPLGADKLGAEKYAEYANDIHHSGDHLLSLVNDILDISAIEAGKHSIAKEAIDIDDLLKDCLRNIEKRAGDRGIDLSLELPKEALQLYADKRSFTQIFLNLLSNAIKFTEHNGTVVVSVKARNKSIEITVVDTGIGISAKRLPTITEPFAQTGQDPYNAQQGTGLGLSIAKALIEGHDGKLIITSKLGVGTSVIVIFPEGLK